MLDYTGKQADGLKKKSLYLLDMDGTIYNENQIFEGTLDFLKAIEEQGGQYIFITNNSSKSVEDYVEKVRAMGICAGYEHFYTSSQATAMYLQENYPGQVVYCMGTDSLVQELRKSGIEVVTEVDDRASVVLIGFDTNPDLVCPVSFGYIPDCGSMSIMLKNATGKEPFFIGKPEPIMVNCVLKKQNKCPEEAVIVGDRLYTDIKTGERAGVDTICVLSGEASMEDIQNSEVKPTYIFKSVKEIYEGLTE